MISGYRLFSKPEVTLLLPETAINFHFRLGNVYIYIYIRKGGGGKGGEGSGGALIFLGLAYVPLKNTII